MQKLDDLIREALEGEDREILKATEEQGFFALSLSQFSGKLGWVSWVIMATQIALFLAGAYCAWYFYQATDPLMALKWGITSAVLWLSALNIKLSLMPQMQADRVIREIKRLELMVATRDRSN